ncbi:hypothetical protein PIROE2DRAFT_48205, partial [Piromyces sp. E2]
LGFCYLTGDGIKKNVEKAVMYFKKTADHKNAPPFIFFELGYFYQHGIGTEKNLKQANHWYKCLAAVRGHAMAQYLLGRHFLLGQVIPFSLKFGVHWLSLSADQGHADALYDLGCLYLSDYSPLYHNVEQGRSYLQQAIDHGNLKAKKILNQLKKGLNKEEE